MAYCVVLFGMFWLLIGCWNSIRNFINTPESIALPFTAYLMLAVPFAMLATSIFLLRAIGNLSKGALFASLGLASSPTWPFLISQLGPDGFWPPQPFLGVGITSLWMPVFGALALYFWWLIKSGTFD